MTFLGSKSVKWCKVLWLSALSRCSYYHQTPSRSLRSLRRTPTCVVVPWQSRDSVSWAVVWSLRTLLTHNTGYYYWESLSRFYQKHQENILVLIVLHLAGGRPWLREHKALWLLKPELEILNSHMLSKTVCGVVTVQSGNDQKLMMFQT